MILTLKNFLNKKNIFFYNFKSNWFKDENIWIGILFEKKFSIGNVSRRSVKAICNIL